tara:strand:- start:112 stop:318 length:207 start_codon:yes stop_codon:yes gene_type:complete
MKLSDNVIAQLVRLLQLAILTGTDISDNLRMLRLVAVDDVLELDSDYADEFETNLQTMLSDVERLNGT